MISQKWLAVIALLIAALVEPTRSSAAPRLAVVTTRMPLARQDASYDFQTHASGGVAPYTWSVDGLSGSGLSASPQGVISGTAQVVGSYNLEVTVQDSSVPPLKAQGALLLTIYANGLPGAIGRRFFGLHAHNSNSEWPAVSSKANPFGVVRLWDDGVAWAQIEKSQSGPDWSLLDTYMKLAQANGVGVLYELSTTPTWASSDPEDTSCKYGPGTCDAPADWQTFDDFVTALVSRYKTTGVQTGCTTADPHCHGVIWNYELWNEPFVAREWNPAQKIYNYDPTLTMQAFVKMTQDAQSIIKSIDPRAAVDSPSGNFEFFSQYWATPGAITNFDHVDLHAYPVESNHQSLYPVPEGMIGQTRLVVNVMAKYQIGSPLMNTEGSWGQFTPPTQDAQAAYAARYILLHVATRMKKFMWYLWTGMAALWDTNLTPAGQGYQQVSTWLLGAKMESSGCLDPTGTFQPDIYQCHKLDGTYVINLARPDNYAAQAVWFVKTNSDGVDWTATSTYNVPAGFTQYLDLSGNVHNVVNSQVTVGASPILLETTSVPGG